MAQEKRLFLLDGMALVYRAHFAFATKPIRTSTGFNTSAIYGFINTLLDIRQNWRPTHLAVAFDTHAPTPRHVEYPAYKAQREEMPEELGAAIPHVRRFVEAMNIRVIAIDGYEADDLIGTLARRAEKDGFDTYMVTPDKDFGQLVDEHTFLWKPGRQGSDVELMKMEDICARWGIQHVDQVIDILGLMGDASDNIPGIKGVGEKTAAKLISQFGSLEEVLARSGEIKGKLGELVRTHAEDARLSKRLATIITDAPVEVDLDQLKLHSVNADAVKALCVEFEMNAIGRRLLGDAFKAGRSGAGPEAAEVRKRKGKKTESAPDELDLFGKPDAGSLMFDAGAPTADPAASAAENPAAGIRDAASIPAPALRTIADTNPRYELVDSPETLASMLAALSASDAFCFDTETDGLDPKIARLLGIAFSAETGTGYYLPWINPASGIRHPVSDLFLSPALKIGHNLKFDLAILAAQSVAVAGPFFDTMIAHALIESDQRHGMDYLSERLLGYSPISITALIGPKGPDQRSMADVPVADVARYAAEDADITWQLREKLLPLLQETGQEKVFHEVEMPVLPTLVAMEGEGIRVDAAVLADFSIQLGEEMASAESDIQRLAGREFNVNSNKQLGEILFNELKLVEKPKKTATGQFATDEQTLASLVGTHEIVKRILDFRGVSKLKSTYADALPQAIHAKTGRVHTNYLQCATATGRLSSNDPNLQNIPIRTDLGQEIRRAFVGRASLPGKSPPDATPDSSNSPGRDARLTDTDWRILSADYSQIELRIIAALSREEAMIEAFKNGQDIHTATAARVFGVMPGLVSSEMRRKAKMVNFGIAYGISAFGLSQRLGLPRKEAAEIIEHYFRSYPGIQRYMQETIEFARAHGYVQTVMGRRRLLRDINSGNATIRGAAERNAINTPIQGTAADMIKIAMARIHAELEKRDLKTKLLLQVHDELVFDLYGPEEGEIRALVADKMKTALDLPVPIDVEIGTGSNWLEAH
jgi:DNA polymerase-1